MIKSFYFCIFSCVFLFADLSNDIINKHSSLCKKGNVNACQIVGFEYQRKNNPQKAAEFFALGCPLNKKKNLTSCNDAGFNYQQIGDYQNMLKYYTIACDNNYPLGCYNLGYVYDTGNSQPQDILLAQEYYNKACYTKNGYYPACGNLARIYLLQYKEELSKQAAEYGCKNNDGLSCYNLGVIYHYNYKDLNMANSFYKKACRLGFNQACNF